ncbi:hypothetical protein ACJX0J_036214, partial [Zea mays]
TSEDHAPVVVLNSYNLQASLFARFSSFSILLSHSTHLYLLSLIYGDKVMKDGFVTFLIS